MADIKQAAKWMQEGRQVRRPEWLPSVPSWEINQDDDLDDESATVTECGSEHCNVEISDLFADDWEVVE